MESSLYPTDVNKYKLTIGQREYQRGFRVFHKKVNYYSNIVSCYNYPLTTTVSRQHYTKLYKCFSISKETQVCKFEEQWPLIVMKDSDIFQNNVCRFIAIAL